MKGYTNKPDNLLRETLIQNSILDCFYQSKKSHLFNFLKKETLHQPLFLSNVVLKITSQKGVLTP